MVSFALPQRKQAALKNRTFFPLRSECVSSPPPAPQYHFQSTQGKRKKEPMYRGIEDATNNTHKKRELCFERRKPLPKTERTKSSKIRSSYLRQNEFRSKEFSGYGCGNSAANTGRPDSRKARVLCS